MKKGMLIVMEGACDGIGKSTQYNKLYDKLVSLNYDVVCHHFPTYNAFYGSLVEAYLAGKFGSIDELSPYFINSLYAVDRACAWHLELRKAYENGKIILLDRYTTSSIIYQSSTITDLKSKNDFIDYVQDYEYKKLNIPKPDLVLFLDAPFDMVSKMRSERHNYEGNSNDIHEINLDFMRKVYDNSKYIAKYLNWEIITCNNNDEMKSIQEINDQIVKKVLTKIKK